MDAPLEYIDAPLEYTDEALEYIDAESLEYVDKVSLEYDDEALDMVSSMARSSNVSKTASLVSITVDWEDGSCIAIGETERVVSVGGIAEIASCFS
jgi:hypothetical protein